MPNPHPRVDKRKMIGNTKLCRPVRKGRRPRGLGLGEGAGHRLRQATLGGDSVNAGAWSGLRFPGPCPRKLLMDLITTTPDLAESVHVARPVERRRVRLAGPTGGTPERSET